ncbi:TetR family transcriptional regulator [Granulicella sp. WH15]|uniref:TetR/AcrR family transcriptional regulator n=1 Tax=Granulicella sp. WH15 TaxID=2602070 RepID=UPI0013679315|nr:TetR/AcrR family transcriptional regulator [Granulicella sp. WH15]QHN05146.1 TetR family transcriptional regulator [Granulicella sp. WH15]
MPYPAKTDRQTILNAALDQVSREGMQGMSLRGVATALDLAPTALYRYFADRATLESAINAETANRLHAAMKKAVGKKDAVAAIRATAQAYLRFAREHRNLYELLMSPCHPCVEDLPTHQQLWDFVIEQVARVSSREHANEAAVALWAHLHGIAAFEAAHVFGEQKPSRGFDFGLEAWLQAAQAASHKKT